MYLVNNNECRNYCISYGKNNGYEWTFVLDSNSFFTKKAFEDIVKNIDDKCEYLIIPQKRLKDNNLSNNILSKINEDPRIDKLPNREPQIAFKNSSSIIFNSKIPYGIGPKSELLNAINVSGNCNIDMYFYGLDIKLRKFENVNFKIVSHVIRLDPHNFKNHINYNWKLRWIGIYLLVSQIVHLTITDKNYFKKL